MDLQAAMNNVEAIADTPWLLSIPPAIARRIFWDVKALGVSDIPAPNIRALELHLLHDNLDT